jgi:predicted nucleic acid-binding protein
MMVTDASALIEVLLQMPSAKVVEGQLFKPGQTLHAPHLIDVEIAQVIRRHAAAGRFDEARGREIIEDLADLRIRRYPHGALLPRIWELRDNLSAYDAAYVALAEALDAPLLTRDHKLAEAARRFARVEVV